MENTWRFIAARAQGSSHVRLGTPCQDQFACEPLASGGMIAAVADGAGSAPNSERGAEIAVRTTVAEARRLLAAAAAHDDPASGSAQPDFETILREAAFCAREAVVAEALQAGANPSSYASTLLALVITPQGGAAVQIGDGVIVVRTDSDLTTETPDLTGRATSWRPKPVRSTLDATWHYVIWPQHGEYVNTTYFLTRDDAPDRLEVVDLDSSVADFALTTDGLQSLVLQYDARAVHAPFFDSMFRPLVTSEDAAAEDGSVDRLSAALKGFLASDRITSRTDDDVTLLLASRRRTAAGLDPPA